MTEQGKILIVDDDENVRRALRRDLRRLGHACDTAADGREGLEKLRGDHYDVVLSDMMMPRMGGMELLDALGQAGLDVVPIILSGQGQIAEAVEATKRGAFDFIEKPAPVGAVASTVARALKHREALRRARAMADLARLWESTFDASPDMIVVLDREGRIFQVNQAVANRLHSAKEALIGRPCHEALCADHHGPEGCPFLVDLSGGQTRSCELPQEAWGGCFEIKSAGLTGGEGQDRGSMHVIRDISDRKLAEQVLREARAEAELLIRSISSILICLDENQVVRQWNASAAETFGISAFDVVGSPLGECGVTWEASQIEAGLSRCATSRLPVRVDDVPFRRRDGRDGFLAVTLNPMRGADLRDLGVLILGRDITERKLLEAQLAQAQKLESIGQLAAGIAHEINTPMQFVGDNIRFLEETFGEVLALLGGYGEVLAAAARGEATAAQFAEAQAAAEQTDVAYLAAEIPRAVEQSLEGVGRVTRIVRAMRDFSHPGTAEKVAIDLNRAAESTITVCRNEWKYVAELVTEFDEELPAVPCFPGELNQVILNLIINAAHAIAKVVGDGSAGKGSIRLTTRRRGDWAELRVEDTGCGIPKEIQSKVWEPFFTTKEVGKGTGQGLAFARSVIVTKHQGTISFESESGKGTTFVVRLPLLQDAQPARPTVKELIDARKAADSLRR